MTAFGWKRKIGQISSNQALGAFSESNQSEAASRAIEYKKTWWEGFQTLGRAQLGLGEIKLARRSFQIALHLNPADEELRKNDLRWVVKLYKKYHELQTTESTEGTQAGKLFT